MLVRGVSFNDKADPELCRAVLEHLKPGDAVFLPDRLASIERQAMELLYLPPDGKDYHLYGGFRIGTGYKRRLLCVAGYRTRWSGITRDGWGERFSGAITLKDAVRLRAIETCNWDDPNPQRVRRLLWQVPDYDSRVCLLGLQKVSQP